MSRMVAMTNEFGQRATLADTVSPVGLHETREVNVEPRKRNIKVDEIFYLSLDEDHGLLAKYLLRKYDLYSRKKVKYGKDGRVKWIEVDGQTYWERKSIIHDCFGPKKVQK